MRKLLTRILVFLLAVTSVFGLTGLKSVKAEEVAVSGMQIVGASLRANATGEEDLTGIRFETTITKEAFNALIDANEGKVISFGTKISDVDGFSPVYLSYVTSENMAFAEDENDDTIYKYYASITFNDKDFALDVLKMLRNDDTLTTTEGATEEELLKIEKYKQASYAELLKATSYYEIDGTKYYTTSLVRSMRMVGNHYDKNGYELPEGFKAKNYFIAGEEYKGYLKEDGSVVVDGFDASVVTGVSTKASPEALAFTNESGLNVTVPTLTNKNLGSNVVLYAFDKTNKVYSLTLKYVTDLISKAEDLQKFNVGYTFDATEYANATDKDAYLAKCQENPYDYYEGYYVLTNDIDATGITFDHEAVMFVDGPRDTKVTDSNPAPSTHIGFGWDATNKTYTTNLTLAQDYDGNGTVDSTEVKYFIPHDKYPALVGHCRRDNNKAYYTTAMPYEHIGFYGTFDGQGHVISNLNAKRSDSLVINYMDGTTQNTFSGYGAGIFGVLNAHASITNVALVNLDASKSSAFALAAYNSLTSDTFEEGEIYYGAKNKVDFTNMYIQLGSTTTVGTTYSLSPMAGAAFNNLFIDATNLTSASTNYSGQPETGILGGNKNYNSGAGAGYTASNVYVATSLSFGILGNESYVSNTQHMNVIKADTVEGLYSATADLYGNEETMAEAFADAKYFEVIGSKVFWNGFYASQLKFVDAEDEELNSIELGEINALEVYLADDYGKVDAEVSFNTDVLTYENGFIKVVTNKVGSYEATFTYGDYSKVITVAIVAQTIEKEGYLQEDGEVVGVSGLDVNALNGATYKVNEVIVNGEVVGGKLYLDLSNVELTAPTTAAIPVAVEISTESANYVVNASYVTMAIDEATDLQKFNVGYTFDATEYTNATDKDAYLAKCQENPYDYYEGYYVLTNDIDATGIAFDHEAVMHVYGTRSSKGTPPTATIGFGWNATESQYVVNNTTAVDAAGGYLAQDYDGNGTVDSTEAKYLFPHDKYPALVAECRYDNNKAYYSTAMPYEHIGFYGTFDGQGYKISNLNAKRSDSLVINYMDGTTQNTFSGYGAGIFGVLNAHASITNVALVNLDASKSSAFALIAYCSISGTEYSEDEIYYGAKNKVDFTNMYIQLGSTTTVGTTHTFSPNAGAAFNNLFIDATNLTSATTLYSGQNETGVLGGGKNHNSNSGAGYSASNVYVATSLAFAQIGVSTTCKHMDVTKADTVEGLYSATANLYGTAKTMSDSLTGDYWTNPEGTTAVYWHTLVPQS